MFMVPFRYSRHPNLCYPNHFPRATNYPRTGNYPAGVMQVSYSRGWGGAIYKLNRSPLGSRPSPMELEHTSKFTHFQSNTLHCPFFFTNKIIWE